ncbi:MAG: agmatinase [Deltaproteobacteria bacterium]|nr:agmatinase [Deltaproteobacteria bacterium]
MPMQKLYFHGDDVAPATPDQALFHVIAAPYEKTVSYQGGTAAGPRAILEASYQLELFDGQSIPAQAGIHTQAPIDCSGEEQNVLNAIRQAVTEALRHRAVPVLLGGEHTISQAAIQALKQFHSEFGVIQFDAHADLRDSYQGNPLSHACVMKRIFDLDIPIFQIGTRNYSYEEHIFRQKYNIPFADAETIFRNGIKSALPPGNFPKKVFVTFDIDCFDPSLIPATGTPVPGGLDWYQVKWILEAIAKQHRVIGFDVVELAPAPAAPAAAFAGAQLVYNLMGLISRQGDQAQISETAKR